VIAASALLDADGMPLTTDQCDKLRPEMCDVRAFEVLP
jgi:hypothetical protein